MIQVHGECIDQLNYRSPSPLSFRVVTGGDSRLQGSEDQQYDHLLEERPGVPCHHTLPQTRPPVSECGSLVLLWPVVKKKRGKQTKYMYACFPAGCNYMLAS